jgi:hypothetical protein
MRSQQRTSWGFDADSDPRLEARMAAARLQRSFDRGQTSGEADDVSRDVDAPVTEREPEPVGAGAGERR